eukprot:COSAG05_NODE_5135_length_1255_cov_36.875923_1_plen_414_part_10
MKDNRSVGQRQQGHEVPFEWLTGWGSGYTGDRFLNWTELREGMQGFVYRIERVQPRIGVGTGENFRRLSSLVLKQVKDETDREDLNSEFRGLAQLRHPHIVEVVGFCWGTSPKSSTPGWMMLIEEMAGDLEGLVIVPEGTKAPFPLPWPVVIRILGQLVGGMSYIHAAGVNHFDLKLGNVLVSTKNHKEAERINVKIADFGMQTTADTADTAVPAAGGSAALERTESPRKFSHAVEDADGIGTHETMAPEALRMAPESGSDIWSAAVICWSLATRQNLFAGFKGGLHSFKVNPAVSDAVDTKRLPQRAAKGERASFPAAKFPEPYRLLIQCGWAHDPKKRPEFASMQQVIRLFEGQAQQWQEQRLRFEADKRQQEEAAAMPSKEKARKWLKSLGFLSQDQIDAAVGYVQEEGDG